jgi:dimethylamine corrinoid protein
MKKREILMASEKELVNDLATAVGTCNRNAIVDSAKAVLAAGVDPEIAITEGLMPGIEGIENRFKQRSISMPTLVTAENAAKEARYILLSQTPDEHPLKRPVKVVIGIAEGDPHSIGKSISVAMLGSRGFKCYDLGEDVPANRFIEKAEEVRADVIAVGTLVLSCMCHQKEVIDMLEEKGLRDNHKVIICGRTEIITPSFAEEIGSDACGVDINDFVEKIQKLTNSKDFPEI